MAKDIWDDEDDPVPITAVTALKIQDAVGTKPRIDIGGTTEGERLLTTEEAANFLRLTPKGVRTMAASGRIPCFKLGRSYRFRRGDLLALLTMN